MFLSRCHLWNVEFLHLCRFTVRKEVLPTVASVTLLVEDPLDALHEHLTCTEGLLGLCQLSPRLLGGTLPLVKLTPAIGECDTKVDFIRPAHCACRFGCSTNHSHGF